jgi:nucleotide sugar dehydrogenase
MSSAVCTLQFRGCSKPVLEYLLAGDKGGKWMKIQIIGVGVVGGAQAYLASKLGHEVVGVDRDRSEFEHARMVNKTERDVDVTFICTQESVVPGVIAELVDSDVQGLYVIKSTVPAGTTRTLMEQHGVHICHNPEFLVEKTAFESISHPNMVVIGECCPDHSKTLQEFYAPLGCPIVISHPNITEMVKLTLNSYLATLVSFWNQIDMIAGALGVTTKDVADTVKLDPRVSSYGTEFFGSPFGGKCLPKDLDQLINAFHKVSLTPAFLEAMNAYNRSLNVNTL